MAIPKNARVKALKELNGGVLLDLQLAPEDFTAVRGGRYIILNSAMPVDDATKSVKRAFSILDYDAASHSLQFAIKAMEKGGVARYLCESLHVGHEFVFSGPWGKLEFPNGGEGPVLALATYTGITALLGLMRECQQPSKVDFLWYRPAGEAYFLSDDEVRERALKRGVDLQIRDCPAVENPEQAEFFAWECQNLLNVPYERLLLAGDGNVHRQLRAAFEQKGLRPEDIQEEVFFRKQKAGG